MLRAIKAMQYEPRSHQKYWCNHCDTEQVESQNPESGQYFVAFGHKYEKNSSEYDGEYLGVMFALCKNCLKEENKD